MQLWGMVGVPPSCAILGGFAIGARISLLWQHTRLMQNVSDDASTRCVGGHSSDLSYVRHGCRAAKQIVPLSTDEIIGHAVVHRWWELKRSKKKSRVQYIHVARDSDPTKCRYRAASSPSPFILFNNVK